MMNRVHQLFIENASKEIDSSPFHRCVKHYARICDCIFLLDIVCRLPSVRLVLTDVLLFSLFHIFIPHIFFCFFN